AWHEEHGFRTARHEARLVGIERSRDDLDVRIATRARAMLEAGWIDEVRALCARGFGETRPMGSVGYRQVKEHVDGSLAANDLEDAIVRATRVFVRRQRTWLRDQPVAWVR